MKDPLFDYVAGEEVLILSNLLLLLTIALLFVIIFIINIIFLIFSRDIC